MKRFLVLVAIGTIPLFPAFAQKTESRVIGNFSGIKVAEGVEAYLEEGDDTAVKIEVTGADPSDVVTEISGSFLKIHMRDRLGLRNVKAKVYVTYVSIDKLSASSAGSIYSEGPIRARSIDINASSAGTVDITLDGGIARITSSSAGDVELKGKVREISVEASSAGKVDAYDLAAENVTAEASSGGTVKLNVRESLVANASSGGNIRFRGNPRRSNTKSTSGGSVKKSD